MKNHVLLILLALALLAACQPAPLPPADPSPGSTPTSSPGKLPTPVVSPSAALTGLPQPAVNAAPTAAPAPDLAGRTVRLRVDLHERWTGELAALAAEFSAANDWGLQLDLVQGASEQPADLVLGLQPPAGALADGTDGWAAGVAEAFFPAAGVPESVAQGSLPLLINPRLLAYNQTWAAELGQPGAPSDWDAFAAQMCAARQAMLLDDDVLNDGTGGWILDSDPETAASWLAAFGQPLALTNPGGQWSTPKALAAFHNLRALQDESCAWTPRLLDQTSYFASRLALAITIDLQDVPAVQRALRTAGSQDAWTVLGFPGPGGPRIVGGGPRLYVVGQAADPDQERAAWLAAGWLLEPGSQRRLAEASGLLPVNRLAAERMNLYAAAHPQWAAARALLETGVPAPADPRWALARRVLGDANHQLYRANTTPETIPALLEELDLTLEELMGRTEP